MKKRRSLALVFMFVFILCGYSQPKDKIALPKGGKDIEFTQLTNLYSLYVTKNQEVYNDGKKLEYFQDISYTLQHQKNSLEPWMPFKMLLYADGKVLYKFIDKIKNQFSIFPWGIYFMTDNTSDLKGTSFRYTTHIKEDIRLEKINTLEEDIFISQNSFEETIDIGLAWQMQLEEYLYASKKEEVQKILKEYPAFVLTVAKNKTKLHNNESIDYDILKELINKNKILFLKFKDDIYYEDYLDALQEIKKIKKVLRDKNENNAYIIEISFELESLLKEMNIQL